MHDLIDKYFTKFNVHIPLLHRPTFEKGIADGLHRRDEGFGSTVLLVCAMGSRWSSDPRVILPGTNSGHSSGWEWFSQVQWVRRSLLSPPRLYDLQISCVSNIIRFDLTVADGSMSAAHRDVLARVLDAAVFVDRHRDGYTACTGRWRASPEGV